MTFINVWINILNFHWSWISWIDFFFWLLNWLDWLWLFSNNWWRCFLDWNYFFLILFLREVSYCLSGRPLVFSFSRLSVRNNLDPVLVLNPLVSELDSFRKSSSLWLLVILQIKIRRMTFYMNLNSFSKGVFIDLLVSKIDTSSVNWHKLSHKLYDIIQRVKF